MPMGMTSAEYKRERPHDFWQARIRDAYRRLERSRKETQWKRWADLASMRKGDKLHFAEAARRDIRLDVLGEVPIVEIKTYRHADSRLEEPMMKLASVELDAEHNWQAVTRVADDASLAGIGWLRVEWVLPKDYTPEPELTPEQETLELASANQQLQACLLGQIPPVQQTDAHFVHIQVLAQALGETGLDLRQRAALMEAVRMHQQYLPAMPAHGFRISRVHPADMLWDPTAGEWKDAWWVAERSVQLVEDVRANKEFKNTSRLQGRAEVRQPGYQRRGRKLGGKSAPGSGQPTGPDAPEDLYEVLWYIHDLRDNQLIVIAEDNPEQKPLVQAEWPYPGTVYYPLVYDWEADGVEGVSDFQKIAFTADKREEVQLRWIEHLALHSKAKILHTADFVDEKGRAQIADPNRILCEVKTLSGYQEMQRPDINPDAYRVDNVLAENINRFAGSTDMSQGVGKGSSSATEASLLDTARGRVVRERRKAVSRMLCWAVRMMLRMYHDFATERIFVEKGASPELDVLIDPQDITDNVWITADTDSLSPANAELEKQQTRQSVEVIASSEWIMQGLGTQGRLAVLEKFLRTQRLLRNPRQILNAAVAEMQASQAIMMAQARKMGADGSGQPERGAGQASGNLQTGVQSLSPGGNGEAGLAPSAEPAPVGA